MPGIALNACVRMLAPASNAAMRHVVVRRAVADRHHHRGVHELPQRVHLLPGSSGASVTCTRVPFAAASSRSMLPRSGGLANERRIVSATVGVVEERAFQVGAEDQRVGCRGIRQSPSSSRSESGSDAVTSDSTERVVPWRSVQRERGADAISTRIERARRRRRARGCR